MLDRKTRSVLLQARNQRIFRVSVVQVGVYEHRIDCVWSDASLDERLDITKPRRQFEKMGALKGGIASVVWLT